MTQPIHVCPGCRAVVARAWIACRDCWPQVPQDLRYALRDARLPHQYRVRRDAIARIVAWLGTKSEVSS